MEKNTEMSRSLPLEKPLCEALKIYRKRLFVFLISAVIAVLIMSIYIMAKVLDVGFYRVLIVIASFSLVLTRAIFSAAPMRRIRIFEGNNDDEKLEMGGGRESRRDIKAESREELIADNNQKDDRA